MAYPGTVPTDRILLARLRGGFVGATSGAVGIAAHALGGGGLPGQGTAVLLVAAAVVAGTIAASTRIPVVVILAAGQVLGHGTFTLGSGHAHAPSPAMIAAHVAAVGVAALLVSGAERGCRLAVSAVGRLVRNVLTVPAWQVPATVPVPERPDRLRAVVALVGRSVRGPPAVTV